MQPSSPTHSNLTRSSTIQPLLLARVVALALMACIMLWASAGGAGAQVKNQTKTLTVNLPLDRHDPLVAQIAATLDTISNSSKNTLAFSIKHSSRASEAFSILSNQEADITWAYHPVSFGRLSWLKFFSWAGLSGKASDISRGAWRLYQDIFTNEIEFRSVHLLALAIYPPARLYASKSVDAFDDLATLSLRCRTQFCLDTATLIGARSTQAADKRIEKMIADRQINAMFFHPRAGRFVPKEESTWLAGLTHPVLINVPWIRGSGSLIMSNKTWSDLVPEHKRIFNAWTGEKLSVELAETLERVQQEESDASSSTRSVIINALPAADRKKLSDKIRNWRKDRIDNNKNLAALEALFNPR